jgi:Fuc2NAc and GlcNAc transferase
MSLTSHVLIPFMTFVLALCGTGLALRLAVRVGLLDRPSERSSHSTPTPRGGGVAIVVAFFSATAALRIQGLLDPFTFIVLLAGGGAVALIGFADDRVSVAAPVRLLVHLGAAALAVIILGGLPICAPADCGITALWLARIAAFISIAWAINLFNFMDGIDGLAAVEAVFVAGAGGSISLVFSGESGLAAAWFCLAAASLGFLAWNWPPARIFMGDVGSGFLGFALAILGMATSRGHIIPVEVWPILGGIFVVDASVTLVRRMVRGDRWFEAHRMHAYQHLSRAWSGHKPVTVLMSSINVCWLLPWAWYTAGHESQALLSMTIALLPLVAASVISGAGRR